MLLLFVISVLLAQVPGPAPTLVANPVPDLSALAYVRGTWTCHSMLRGKDRPNTSTGTAALNGRWIVAHDVAPPFDAYRAGTIHTDTYYTYDSAKKTYVAVSIDDFGGYGMATSPGWKGNTIVWTDRSAPDGSVTVRTIAKVNERAYNVRLSGTDARGKAVTVLDAECSKP